MTSERTRLSGTHVPALSPEAVLFQLVAALDTAPDEASALRLALDAIVSVIPCEQALLHIWSGSPEQVQMRCGAATEQAFLAEYISHCRASDPLVAEVVQQRCLKDKRNLSSEEVISPDALRQTLFHRRLLARRGDLVHSLCHYAELDADHRTGLRLFRRSDQTPFSRCERELLDLFHSQIAIALRHRHALAQARHERDALQAGVDLLNQPLFLLDGRARVIACNRAATALAREGRQLELVDGQLLPGRQLDHASWVSAAISRLHHTSARSHLQPLPGQQKGPPRHYGLLSALPGNHKATNTAAALLTLIDMQQAAPRHAPEELRRAFDFTAAEARIADALMTGLDTEEISSTFLIRRDTVRCHIKRLLAKTGTPGHAALQKLLLRLSPNFVTLQQKNPTAGS